MNHFLEKGTADSGDTEWMVCFAFSGLSCKYATEQ